MDGHPDHNSGLPAHNPEHVRNLSDDSATSHPASQFDKSRSSQSNDPQTIFNDLYSPSVEHRGRPIDESHEADDEYEPSYSSVVYLGHNVFERHKNSDFLHSSSNNPPHQLGHRPSTAGQVRSDGRPDATFHSRTIDPAARQMIDSDIVRWATAIPDNLPLNLSALAVILRSSADRMPPTTEYATMAFLAIFESPGRRLTDKELLDALKDGFAGFRSHSEMDFWKCDVINRMLSDSRFKASHEGDRSWTIDISEVHRRPFVHREARDRPMRLLPPGPDAPAKGQTSATLFNSDDVEMDHPHSAQPVGGGTGTVAHPSLQRQYSAVDATLRRPLSRASSDIPPLYDPTHHTIPPVRSPPPQRTLSNSSGPLPPLSEVLPTGEPSGLCEDQVHTVPGAFDNSALPSIRDVLSNEMHLVDERGRTRGC